MPQIDSTDRQFNLCTSTGHQANNVKISRDAGVTVELGTNLYWLTTRRNAGWQGVQHAAAVTKPSNPLMIQKMRVADLIPERDALIQPDYYTRRNLVVQRKK